MENHHMVILNILNIGADVNNFQNRINILLIFNKQFQNICASTRFVIQINQLVSNQKLKQKTAELSTAALHIKQDL